MKSYDEIASSIFKRRDEYIANQNRKKRIVIITIASALCCSMVLIISHGLWKNGFFSNDIPISDSLQNSSNNYIIIFLICKLQYMLKTLLFLQISVILKKKVI